MSTRRRVLRVSAFTLAGLLVATAVAGGWAYTRLRASLPLLDGRLELAGLAAPVRLDRDAHGVVTVRGDSRADVAFGLGFAHAQDRFFQMDLLRRRAAGELAELVGPVARPLDERTRRHRLRAVARRALDDSRPEHRVLVEAYAAGVAAGLAHLGAEPFEYLLLRSHPAPWAPEDTLLVVLAMFIDLNGETGAYEAAMGALHAAVPPPVFELLAPMGSGWDAPLTGDPMPDPPLPGADVLDLRRHATLDSRPAPAEPSGAAGSNSFAVAGTHSAHGGALLADDMHLRLGVPNIWYRASLVWRDGELERRVTGVTLPGTPAVVAGSNGAVAWGFTNSYGDWQDLVDLPAEGDRYLTPDGPRALTQVREVVHVRGAPDVTLDVVETIWGPVVSDSPRRALAWTAHLPGAVDLALVDLERARDVDQALDVAARAGIPPQNFQVADHTGRIGWTVAGAMPARFGHDGRLPSSWADGTRGWRGLRAPADRPRVVDPPSGRLWTANARTVDGAALALLGDGGYGLGARARQIRDDLFARDRFDERALLAIQLDDRALFLARWQALLLGALGPEVVAADARRAEARRLVEAWGGRAGTESAGYRIVREWWLAVTARVLAPFAAVARRVDPAFDAKELLRSEAAVWRLVTERPAHLLAPTEGSWDHLLLAALDETLARLTAAGPRLADHTWGERNTAAIRHPLSRAVPLAAWLLDMPAVALPGDISMPRVQGPSFGASERFVVSPGREAEGLFHMPGGQSGHPLSSFYRDGFEAWARGEPTPFLPGATTHRLALEPAAGR